MVHARIVLCSASETQTSCGLRLSMVGGVSSRLGLMPVAQRSPACMAGHRARSTVIALGRPLAICSDRYPGTRSTRGGSWRGAWHDDGYTVFLAGVVDNEVVSVAQRPPEILYKRLRWWCWNSLSSSKYTMICESPISGTFMAGGGREEVTVPPRPLAAVAVSRGDGADHSAREAASTPQWGGACLYGGAAAPPVL